MISRSRQPVAMLAMLAHTYSPRSNLSKPLLFCASSPYKLPGMPSVMGG